MFKSVTVIGAGLMGSGIAAHLTNAGIKVNLLDVVLEENENRNFLAQNAVNKL
ncbi:MAG: 3-hydroxyacyl-CoA dehydrogenase NAD-binding domain-containing protein, partial [Pseudomonadota bacterium]|nr:3-hydroxyacyl-CoA dehydrogenase NAD-binding domain-containing protein [Pseudomonadota bacterium]